MATRRRLAQLVGASGLSDLLLGARRRFGSPWLTVLTYHRVCDPRPGDGSLDALVDASAAAFDAQVEFFQRAFDLVGLDELAAIAAGAPWPANPLCITFDDGYRDNHDVALPILRRHGARAVFFVATEYVAARRVFWWDRLGWALSRTTRRRLVLRKIAPLDVALDDPRAAFAAVRRLIKERYALPLEALLDEIHAALDVPWDRQTERTLADGLVLDWDQVRAIAAAGQDVASHTRTHRPLSMLPLDEVVAELRSSRADLEAAIDRPVRAIAFPLGEPAAGRPPVREALRAAGYELGFTNKTGANLFAERLDPLSIRRIPIDGDIGRAQLRGVLALPPLTGG